MTSEEFASTFVGMVEIMTAHDRCHLIREITMVPLLKKASNHGATSLALQQRQSAESQIGALFYFSQMRKND